MTTVIVVCEGRTEAAFVENLLQPPLAHGGIYVATSTAGSPA